MGFSDFPQENISREIVTALRYNKKYNKLGIFIIYAAVAKNSLKLFAFSKIKRLLLLIDTASYYTYQYVSVLSIVIIFEKKKF